MRPQTVRFPGKMVPITGRVGSFLELKKNPISIQIKSNPFFALLSSSIRLVEILAHVVVEQDILDRPEIRLLVGGQ